MEMYEKLNKYENLVIVREHLNKLTLAMQNCNNNIKEYIPQLRKLSDIIWSEIEDIEDDLTFE